MPLRPLIAKPSPVALCLGVVAMVLVYGLGSFVLNLALPRWSFEASQSRIVALTFPFVSYLASGFVVGYMAKRAPLMHGALLGLLVMGLFAGVTFVVAGELSWEPFSQLAVGAMVVCALGAIVGNSVAHR